MSLVVMEHQIEAAAFLAGEPGHMLVGDPGVGKTGSSISAMKNSGARSALITCPAIATSNWVREFALFGSDLNVVDARRHPKRVKDADVVVISMDSMRTEAMKELVRSRAWDFQIVDEAQGLADPDSQRTAATYAPQVKAGKVVQLTGTPASRHVGQVWTHINRTAPERIDHQSYDQFCEKYCTIVVKRIGGMRFAQPVIVGNKPNMIAEFRARMQGWWLRQRKEDVLPNMPPKTFAIVDLAGSRADLKAIENELDPEVFEALEFAVETGDIRALGMMSDQVSKLRRLVAMIKVKPLVEYVEALKDLPGMLPLSIWGWHTEPLHRLQDELRKRGLRVGLIDGATPLVERDRIVAAFQSGQLDIFVGQIKAAGTAITLTYGHRALFMEESFNPADNAQASDRHHRIGQKDTVHIDRAILTGTIDEAVAAICDRRNRDWELVAKDM